MQQFQELGVLGTHSPRALVNSVWMNNCVFFGMSPGQKQRTLRWGDLQLKTDIKGSRYVEFDKERLTKTRNGEKPKTLNAALLKAI